MIHLQRTGKSRMLRGNYTIPHSRPFLGTATHLLAICLHPILLLYLCNACNYITVTWCMRTAHHMVVCTAHAWHDALKWSTLSLYFVHLRALLLFYFDIRGAVQGSSAPFTLLPTQYEICSVFHIQRLNKWTRYFCYISRFSLLS